MPTVSVENVDVSFPLYQGAQRSLRHRIIATGTGGRVAADSRNRATVEALKDVTFSLQSGDRLALIGHNGAGKTTLLRVLAGIYEPLQGRVLIEGRVAPLFDVGLGMDMEATGYDNIRIRGLYLGLSHAEIAERRDEIATFTELGPFLDMPVRTYSAGMQTRLAFAVSTSITPEVLLLDEGIGAGDAAFMDKAKERLSQFIERAGVMVLASHSVDLVRRFCTRGLVLTHGQVAFAGSAEEALEFYAASAVERSSNEPSLTG